MGTLCALGMGAALLELPVGINPVLLLLTPFCMWFPRLEHSMVRVEVQWGFRVPGTAGFSLVLSCPSQSQQLGCVWWVLAGQPGGVAGWQTDAGGRQSRLRVLAPTLQRSSWIWPPCPEVSKRTGSGDRQQVQDGSIGVMPGGHQTDGTSPYSAPI